ncbi:hypothetical protein D1872_236830 [compost metagenome]
MRVNTGQVSGEHTQRPRHSADGKPDKSSANDSGSNHSERRKNQNITVFRLVLIVGHRSGQRPSRQRLRVIEERAFMFSAAIRCRAAPLLPHRCLHIWFNLLQRLPKPGFIHGSQYFSRTPDQLQAAFASAKSQRSPVFGYSLFIQTDCEPPKMTIVMNAADGTYQRDHILYPCIVVNRIHAGPCFVSISTWYWRIGNPRLIPGCRRQGGIEPIRINRNVRDILFGSCQIGHSADNVHAVQLVIFISTQVLLNIPLPDQKNR